MKIITIGDLHGSPVWRDIDPSDWDRIVFIGDYVDSDYFTPTLILRNLESVLNFKKRYPDKVVLLLGNHDLAYYFDGNQLHLCSGFDEEMLPTLFTVFNMEKSSFKAAFQVGNYLWTHAGVVNRWYNKFIKEEVLPSDKDLAFTLNRLFEKYYLPLFHISSVRGGINDDGGIFWAHSSETQDDPLEGYCQIVGHTKTHNGIIESDNLRKDTSVTYVDCLKTTIEFHKLILP